VSGNRACERRSGDATSPDHGSRIQTHFGSTFGKSDAITIDAIDLHLASNLDAEPFQGLGGPTREFFREGHQNPRTAIHQDDASLLGMNGTEIVPKGL